MMTLVQRFLRLVSFDTHSDERSESSPSTPAQLELGRELVEQMQQMGIQDAYLDGYGYVYGTVPGNVPDAPVIGLIAHMDVSSDAPSEHIQVRLVENYDGEAILLQPSPPISLDPQEFASLKNHIGKTLIVTDGTTLLGADDKAGIAEILEAAKLLLATEEPHATLRIAFTPDEEIGRGADHFDVEGFAADYAYTVDGGALGELEYENFNAASATVTISGRSIHPGAGKGRLINALLIAMELQAMLPAHEIPFCTEGYEGFYHLHQMSGDVEQASLHYLIRDHDKAHFQARKERLEAAAALLNRQYSPGTVAVEIEDSYYNMRQMLASHLHIVQEAQDAMVQLGITPVIQPIRGGTDGARLSYLGLPCPNLCTGGENFHGRFEYIPVEDMQLVSQLLVRILCNAARPNGTGGGK